MQKTHQSALQVQQKAEALLQANHYDMDMIRDCAEKVMLSHNFSHWRKTRVSNIGSAAALLKLWVTNGLVWLEGRRPLAAADAEDGGPAQAG